MSKELLNQLCYNGHLDNRITLKEAESKIDRYIESKLKEAGEENRILRIDNASYKGAIAIERNKLQAVKDSLYTDEELELRYVTNEALDKRSGMITQRDKVLKALKPQEYCNCPQGGLEKPISETEYECTNCGKEIVNQKP